jgi:hypothetical protein
LRAHPDAIPGVVSPSARFRAFRERVRHYAEVILVDCFSVDDRWRFKKVPGGPAEATRRFAQPDRIAPSVVSTNVVS